MWFEQVTGQSVCHREIYVQGLLRNIDGMMDVAHSLGEACLLTCVAAFYYWLDARGSAASRFVGEANILGPWRGVEKKKSSCLGDTWGWKRGVYHFCSIVVSSPTS